MHFFDLHRRGLGHHHSSRHQDIFGSWRPHFFNHHLPFGCHRPDHLRRDDINCDEEIRRIVREFFEREGHHGPEGRRCTDYYPWGFHDRLRGGRGEWPANFRPWRYHHRRGGRFGEWLGRFGPWTAHDSRRTSCSCHQERRPEESATPLPDNPTDISEDLPRCYLGRRHGVSCREHEDKASKDGERKTLGKGRGKRSRSLRLQRQQRCCCHSSKKSSGCCMDDGPNEKSNKASEKPADEMETDQECEDHIIDLESDAENARKST